MGVWVDVKRNSAPWPSPVQLRLCNPYRHRDNCTVSSRIGTYFTLLIAGATRPKEKTMKTTRFVLCLVAGLLGCGTAAEVEATSEAVMGELSTSPRVQPQTMQPPTDENSLDSASFSCLSCWVRCSDDAPEKCNWTRAHNLGERTNCGSMSGYAHSWCEHQGYKNSWAGCRKSKTEHPKCSCNPDGLCGKS